MWDITRLFIPLRSLRQDIIPGEPRRNDREMNQTLMFDYRFPTL